jgi:S-adenosylmethionine-dependent methyltransferase
VSSFATVDVPTSRRFDRGASAYHDYLRSPLGRLRLDLTWAQLRTHLPTRPLDILDVGGGTGEIAIHLASAGHTVTLVDPSAAMVKIADETARDLPMEVKRRLHSVQATLEDLPRSWPGKTFDAVMCHCTVEYLADETVAFQSLDSLLKDQGFLSIVVPNHEGHALRFAARGMLKQAMEALTTPRVDPDLAFGLQRRAYDLATLGQRLPNIDPIGIYALRIAADLMPESTLADDYAAVLSFESAAASVETHLRLGRFIHLIGQKTVSDLAQTTSRRPPPPPPRRTR